MNNQARRAIRRRVAEEIVQALEARYEDALQRAVNNPREDGGCCNDGYGRHVR